MRYIEIPKNPTVVGKGDKPSVITLPELVLSHLSADKRWFGDTAWEDAYEEIVEAFQAAKLGDVVGLKDSTHEKLELAVREFPFSPEAKPYLLRLVKAITRASKSEPERKETPPPQPSVNGAPS